MDEVFEVFNEKNQLVGTAPRSEVHKKGLIHRGANVFLMNSEGRIFLHKRSENKDTLPGHWGMSMGEHLKPGETFEQAAVRGLKEELGVMKVKLTLLRGPKYLPYTYSDGKIDNEFDALFLAETGEKLVLDKEEIAEGKFFTEEEIDEEITRGERKFTPNFLDEWAEFKRRWYGTGST